LKLCMSSCRLYGFGVYRALETDDKIRAILSMYRVLSSMLVAHISG
jgi:hypothetical protein